MNQTQKYHIEPPCGLMNDPNGLTYYQGQYYVFYQWNRFHLDHSYKEWGLYRTNDWVTWEHHGSALLPDQDYDLQGVYSGSGYVIKNRLHLYYTGNSKINGKRKSCQCLAVSDNGRTFLKKGAILSTPKGYTEHFRDPKVFQGTDGQYFMIIGGQTESGTGAIALCQSDNGLDWVYHRELAASTQYQMVECPDLVRLTEQDILIYCLQKRNNETDENLGSIAVYQTGRFHESDLSFSQTNLDSNMMYLDNGFDFYAPQTFCDHQGRYILLAWMSNMDGEKENAYGNGHSHIHCMTMPRELNWRNNRLYQKPLKETYSLLGAEITGTTTTESAKTDILTFPLSKRPFYLNVSAVTSKSDIVIHILQDECLISWDSGNKELKLTRIDWVTSIPESKICSVEYLEELELWYDTSSVELFINQGEYVISARIEPKLSYGELIIDGLCVEQVQVRSVTSFKK